jgi:hypothetical protein
LSVQWEFLLSHQSQQSDSSVTGVKTCETLTRRNPTRCHA